MRDVRGPERDGALEVAECAGEVLPRQRVHQVEVEVLDAGAAAPRRRRARSRRTAWMRPSAREHRVVEALRAERDAVDAGPGVLGKARVLDGARIRLQRHLDVARHRQQRPRMFQDAPDRVGANRLGVPPPKNTETISRSPASCAANAEVIAAARRRTRVRAARDAGTTCELKSQYGHLRTHHGRWTYSASGMRGGRASSSLAPRRAATSVAQRLAAMTLPILVLRRQFGRGPLVALDQEQRVVSEAAVAPRGATDAPSPVRLGDRPAPGPRATAGTPSRSGSGRCGPRPARARVRAAACRCWRGRRRPGRRTVRNGCRAPRAARRPRDRSRRRSRAGRMPRPRIAP